MHALRVKRLRIGEPVTLFDGEGRLLDAEVLQAGRRDLLVRVLREETEAPPRPAVHVRAAAPKGERADRMLEALSQLGAASFAALRTERSVVEPGEGKLERWRRLAIESAKQAGRAHLLRIDPALDFAQALDNLRAHPGARAALGVTRRPWAFGSS